MISITIDFDRDHYPSGFKKKKYTKEHNGEIWESEDEEHWTKVEPLEVEDETH